MNLESDLAKLRIIAELINFVGAILYLLVALREARFLGYKMFIENLVSRRKGILKRRERDNEAERTKLCFFNRKNSLSSLPR